MAPTPPTVSKYTPPTMAPTTPPTSYTPPQQPRLLEVHCTCVNKVVIAWSHSCDNFVTTMLQLYYSTVHPLHPESVQLPVATPVLVLILLEVRQ